MLLLVLDELRDELIGIVRVQLGPRCRTTPVDLLDSSALPVARDGVADGAVPGDVGEYRRGPVGATAGSSEAVSLRTGSSDLLISAGLTVNLLGGDYALRMQNIKQEIGLASRRHAPRCRTVRH